MSHSSWDLPNRGHLSQFPGTVRWLYVCVCHRVLATEHSLYLRLKEGNGIPRTPSKFAVNRQQTHTRVIYNESYEPVDY